MLKQENGSNARIFAFKYVFGFWPCFCYFCWFLNLLYSSGTFTSYILNISYWWFSKTHQNEKYPNCNFWKSKLVSKVDVRTSQSPVGHLCFVLFLKTTKMFSPVPVTFLLKGSSAAPPRVNSCFEYPGRPGELLKSKLRFGVRGEWRRGGGRGWVVSLSFMKDRN